MSKKAKSTYLEIDGQQYPLKIYREWRRNVRVSMGKRHINLRLPTVMTAQQEAKQLEWCREWVRKQLKKNDSLQQRYQGKDYRDGDLLQVGKRVYQLSIEPSPHRSHRAKLRNGVIQLSLNEADDPQNLQKSVRHLLSRTVASDFLPEITRRVNELNQLYFQQDVRSVRLKYNHSNWGSCSTKGNVNLSTRLLFAPDEVIDYVIIHELAHFLEMNHSPRFWKLVQTAMPDYKEKERWLKTQGHLCDF